MIYLVRYDRRAGTIVDLEEFGSDERVRAESVRLDVELQLLQSAVENEVVLLEASSVEELRKTHRRYFNELNQLLVDSPPSKLHDV